MNDCKKFQDLILTDYIDGEVDEKTKERIDSHVLACAGCRRLVEEVKNNLVIPFKKVDREKVPDQVWLSVKESIEQQKLSGEEAKNFIQRFIESFFFPRLASVMGILVVLILTGTIVFYQQVNQAREKEQGEYLVYLLESTAIFSESDNNGPEIPIEEYFL